MHDISFYITKKNYWNVLFILFGRKLSNYILILQVRLRIYTQSEVCHHRTTDVSVPSGARPRHGDDQEIG